MSKESVIIASYIVISILSTLFLIFILYILFHKTPKEMKIYRWFLVNIQISAYVECIYWALFMAPISEVYPIPHIYCVGLLYRVFGMSGKVLFALETLLHSFVTGSLMQSIGYRYRALCAFESHWFHRFMVKYGAQNDFIQIYIILLPYYTFITYIGLTTDEEARILILKLDPGHVFPADVTAFSDLAYIWIVSIFSICAFGIVNFTSQILDSSRILKEKASSSRTAALHKEAIIALITQLCLMEGVSFFTGFIMVILHFMSLGNENFERKGFWDILLAVNVCLHSLKSVNCSLAIILVHKPYRRLVKNMFWKEETEVIMVSNASSDRNT